MLRLLWWHNWRFLPHMKDEALNPAGFSMESLPLAELADVHAQYAAPERKRAAQLRTLEQRSAERVNTPTV